MLGVFESCRQVRQGALVYGVDLLTAAGKVTLNGVTWATDVFRLVKDPGRSTYLISNRRVRKLPQSLRFNARQAAGTGLGKMDALNRPFLITVNSQSSRKSVA